MKKVGVLRAVLVLALASLCGCDTKNIGHGGFGPGPVTRFNSVSITEAGTDVGAVHAGAVAQFELKLGYTGLEETIEVAWEADGLELQFEADSKQVSSRNNSSSLFEHIDRQFARVPAGTPEGIYPVRFHVTGYRRKAISGEAKLHVIAQDNRPPSFESVSWNGDLLSVVASDPDGDRLFFHAEVISGNIEIGSARNRTDNSIDYPLVARNLISGTDFAIRLTVEDLKTELVETFYESSFDELYLENDTLYALASAGSVSSGDSVRVIVATGITNNRFQYLNGCGVVCENGASYSPWTFDVGDPDDNPDVGSANPIDGVWADMGATAFLLAPDNFITGTDLGNGTSRTDFNITPLGGNDIFVSGILFSFEYSFASAGTYHLGFQAADIVNRTYYTDSSQSEDFFWSDISNDHQYNSIVVN